ncbi:hydrogenase formation protein HypD [Candidatus Dependentiae bacterium]|nr:hydrogenase formation protein HypD [Candidatus Dependentiae bacterium]
MKYIDEYRNSDIIKKYIEKIKLISEKKINIMEICGGHTVAIHKSGFHELFKKNINFLSGPGCPVCVTSTADIDKIIYLSTQLNSILCIYGDLLKVPGSKSSLMIEKASGADIRVVYSVHDALNLALTAANKTVYFAGIGFETTAPLSAAAVLEAEQKNIKNFKLLSLHKTVAPAIRVLLGDADNEIDAFILPGHVSSVTGESAYNFISEQYSKSAVITGFEPLDIISSVYHIISMHEQKKNKIINNYKRAVKPQGNLKAQEILNLVFDNCGTEWRGLGMIENSGLRLKNKFSKYDAEKNMDFPKNIFLKNTGCICSEILTGKKKPFECVLFDEICNPDNPAGACMVSNEGACGAYYKYKK